MAKTTKSLSERIALHMSTRDSGRTGRNKFIFISMQDDIKKALDDGWTAKVIWDTLRDEGKIPFGYPSFNKYIKRFIRNTNQTELSAAEKTVHVERNRGKTMKRKTETTTKKNTDTQMQGFSWNPRANKEELI